MIKIWLSLLAWCVEEVKVWALASWFGVLEDIVQVVGHSHLFVTLLYLYSIS